MALIILRYMPSIPILWPVSFKHLWVMQPMENRMKKCTCMKFLYTFQKWFRAPLRSCYRPFNRTMVMSADCEQPRGANFSHVSFKLVLLVPEQISKNIVEWVLWQHCPREASMIISLFPPNFQILNFDLHTFLKLTCSSLTWQSRRLSLTQTLCP